MENQALLRRLQDKGSHYNFNKWDADNTRRRGILKNICEYPLVVNEKGKYSNVTRKTDILENPPIIRYKEKLSSGQTCDDLTWRKK
jgi:hypothetical protein